MIDQMMSEPVMGEPVMGEPVMGESVRAFWQSFAQSPAAPPGMRADAPAPTYSFGDNVALANELAQLVYAGAKSATCGTLWEWEADGEPIPQVGQLEIVLDGHGQPRCVTEITAVQIKPYNEVDADFAYAEGEDDRSLASWRREHWRYFSRVLPRIGRTPVETMLLVCVRFRVIFKA